MVSHLRAGHSISGQGQSAWPIASSAAAARPHATAPVAMSGSFRASQTIVAGSYTRGGLGSLPRSLPRGSLHRDYLHPAGHDREERKHIVQHGAVDSDIE